MLVGGWGWGVGFNSLHTKCLNGSKLSESHLTECLIACVLALESVYTYWKGRLICVYQQPFLKMVIGAV